ncbi:SirB2 family protein [Methylobacter sp. YRD-M1]|uniref:SirB2 family protein n=1 Tax=Methylobacter sp. YRD-M1 TaxID=2911520 RepID=UPI002DD66EA5|nr:SirB2 family protein [Methylobacter sp. YRD-M1]
MKTIHLAFVALSLFSFIGRVVLSEVNPEMLKQKAFNIGPHVINTILLLSGIILVFQGSWLSMEYGWIIGKIIGLLGYIGLGIMVLHNQGATRWLAFAGALACFAYIGMAAVTKNAWFFL